MWKLVMSASSHQTSASAWNHSRRLRAAFLKSFSTRSREKYMKILYRKLLFFVHPDFLINHTREKEINDTNLKLLSQEMDRKGSLGSTRSLVLYIKATDENSAPRRIKLSLHRLEESIWEVLDTLGEDIPKPQESVVSDNSSRRTVFVSSNPTDIANFLDTLLDKKDLMKWRLEKSQKFHELVDVCKASFGVNDIEIRTSWSSQNNNAVLQNLLKTLDLYATERSHVPWQGMTMVISNDDKTIAMPVDPIEGKVYINPSHVPLQWRSTFKGVTPEVIRVSIQHQRALQALVGQIQEHFVKIINDYWNRMKTTTTAEQNTTVPLVFKIKRGYTCSSLFYFEFLRNHTPDYNYFRIAGEEGVGVSVRTIDTSLQVEPLEICVTVEEGHGSMLLPTGHFRVDCRSHPDATESLIVNQIEACLNLRREYKTVLMKGTHLRNEVIGSLNLQSIDSGVGVDDQMMNTCLVNMQSYIAESYKKQGGKLKNLSGLRVIVGRYMGINDDGSCIIPWDWHVV